MTVPICGRHTTLATEGLSTLGRGSSQYLTYCCIWTLNSYILQLMVVIWVFTPCSVLCFSDMQTECTPSMCRLTKLIQVDGEEKWYVSYIGSSKRIWPISPTEGKGGYRLVLGTPRSGALSSSAPLCNSQHTSTVNYCPQSTHTSCLHQMNTQQACSEMPTQ